MSKKEVLCLEYNVFCRVLNHWEEFEKNTDINIIIINIKNIIFKFPLGNTTLSDKLSDENAYDKLPDKLFLYGIFIVGFIGLWFIPSLLELVNAIGII